MYYAHEVNYFLWGVSHALASEKGTEHGNSITRDSTEAWVLRYRGSLGGAYFNKPYDGTAAGRAAWATAGWDYIKTGVFNPPTEFELPGASPNRSDTFNKSRMTIQLGPYFPDLR